MKKEQAVKTTKTKYCISLLTVETIKMELINKQLKRLDSGPKRNLRTPHTARPSTCLSKDAKEAKEVKKERENKREGLGTTRKRKMKERSLKEKKKR